MATSSRREAAVRIAAMTTGEDHPHYATNLSNLAVLFVNQGRFAEAEPMHLQASEVLRQALGENHPHYAQSLDRLAHLYGSQGRYAEAEPLQLQASKILREALGEDNPLYAVSLNNLAVLYSAQGRYAEAEPLQLQASETWRIVLGEDHPDYAQSLDRLAALYSAQGRYAEAEPLQLQALEIRRAVLGEDHLDYAQSLDRLAALYSAQGRYAEAEPLQLQASKILRETLGENNPFYAQSLNNLAALYYNQSRYADAEPLQLQALEILRQALGEDHPHYAQSLVRLAALYSAQGRYAEAEPLQLQALEIRRAVLGEDHPDYATSLNNLATVSSAQGRYAESEPLYLQALEIRRAVLGEDHPDYAQSLNNLANHYDAQGRYAESEPLYLQALEVLRTTHGEDHPAYATSLNNLAELYRAQGRNADAEPMHLQVLGILREVLGEDHPDYATSLNNLAILYQDQGRYAEAEPLQLLASEIVREVLGEDHPVYAYSLNNLAILYRAQGRYTEAEPLLLKALGILREVLGEDHPAYATSLNKLAKLYDSQGRYTEAEPLYLQALEIRRTALGEDHPAYAYNLNDLANLYEAQGRYAEAEPLYLQALEIHRTALGEDHPAYADSLNDLANLYEAQGRYTEAEPLYLQALEIHRTALGEDHPAYADSLNDLAFLYWSAGRFAEARDFFALDIAVRRSILSRILIGLTDAGQEGLYRRLAYPDLFASVAAALEAAGEDGAGLGLNAALVFKGLLGEIAAQERSWGAAEGSAAWREAYAAYEALAGEAAALQSRLAREPDNTALRLRWEHVREALVAADRRLAQENLVFARERELFSANWEDVAAALAMDAVLLEYVRYDRYDPETRAYEEARYLVYVLGADWDAPALVDLGEAAPIDALLEAWREQLEADIKRSAATPPGYGVLNAADEQKLAAHARALYGLLAAPLFDAGLIAPGTHLVVGPDGPLAFLPFEALVTSAEGETPIRYLAESHPITYVVSGRDIAGWYAEEAQAQAPALIIGDPDYELAELTVAEMPEHIAGALARLEGLGAAEAAPEVLLARQAPTPRAALRLGTAGAEADESVTQCWPARGWQPSAAFGANNAAVAAALEAAGAPYRGPFEKTEALEELLKHAAAPDILAIATHGYHCDAESWQRGIEARRERRRPGMAGIEDAPAALPAEENPLLRVGLTFAGVNTLRERLREGGAGAPAAFVNDGNLTALEVAALNLHGTRLVNLVACETGLGDTDSATGVIGLRSAFRRAGAQSLQMSLFEVPVMDMPANDRETYSGMGVLPDGVTYTESFFAGWLQERRSRREAHHAAQIHLIEGARNPESPWTNGVAHPFYWAAFILIGNPN